MAPQVKMKNRIGQPGADQYAGSDKYHYCLGNEETGVVKVINSIAYTSHREEYRAIEYFCHLWRHLKMKFELIFHYL